MPESRKYRPAAVLAVGCPRWIPKLPSAPAQCELTWSFLFQREDTCSYWDRQTTANKLTCMRYRIPRSIFDVQYCEYWHRQRWLALCWHWGAHVTLSKFQPKTFTWVHAKVQYVHIFNSTMVKQWCLDSTMTMWSHKYSNLMSDFNTCTFFMSG